jgi:Mlc titration factor MtfA (ptsG expression regulator)
MLKCDPLALLPAGDNARPAQDFHVVGEVGLADPHCLQQDAGAFLARFQQFNDRQPVFVAEGLKRPAASVYA